jgi:hypothetical protein
MKFHDSEKYDLKNIGKKIENKKQGLRNLKNILE